MVALPTQITVTCGSAPLQEHVLPPGEYVIGSDAAAHIRIAGDGLAPRHALLSLRFNEWIVENLDGSSGTYVNGEKISSSRVVFPTQKIRIGSATIALRRVKGSAAPNEELAPQTAAVRTLLPEEILGDGRYEIGPTVGRGGMGVILDAHEPAAQRNVAMKLMLDCSRPADIGRFVQEAQITAQLEHPNIVPVHELGVNELGQPFYTMKFVRGVSLGKVLDQLALDDPATAKKYPLSTLLTIFQKICDAIAFAHSKGVIYRDLKPENIMLGEYGEALVMDWGLAKMLGREPAMAVAGDSSAPVLRPPAWTVGGGSSAPTVVGTVMGSLQYMSPEQASGEVEELDARTDLYALGAMLYHLLTLQPPFTGEEGEVLENVRAGTVVRPAEALGLKKVPHVPGGRVPESLAAVAMKAMALKPGDRYQTVPDLQREIASYQSGFATSAENAGAWKLAALFFRRHRTVSIATMLVLLFGAFFAYKMIQARERTESAKRFAADQRDAAEDHSYVSHLLDAGRHLADGYPENALELLLRHRHEPSGRDLRGWEWFHLLGQLNQDRLQVRAHDGGVLALSASADGALLATGGADGTVAIWRSRGLVPEFRLPAHTGPVYAVVWHAGGKMLATGGADGMVRVWDAETRKLLAEMRTAAGLAVRALAWQPEDGGSPRLAVGGLEKEAVLWELPTADRPGRIEILQNTENGVAALSWSADGRQLALGKMETGKCIEVLDFVSRKPVFKGGFPSGGYAPAIAFHPSGKYVAAGSKERHVSLLEIPKGAVLSESPHHGPVSALAWSPDGRQLASASHDRTIRVLTHPDSKKARQMFTGHTGEINTLAWVRWAGAPKSSVLFSGGADGTLRAWPVARSEEGAFSEQADNWIAGARWSPDGRRIAVAAFRDFVDVYTPASGRQPARLVTRSAAFDVEWSPTGDRLAVAERHAGQVEVLDAEKGGSIRTLKLDGVNRVAWSTSGKYLAAASPAGVRVWNAQSASELTTIPRPAGSIAWAADDRRVAIGGEDGAIEIWDGLNGQLIATWRPAPPAMADAVSSKHEPPRQVFDLAWSPDGRRLAFVTQDSVAGLLDARDGRLLRTFTGHGGGIWRLDWSGDSRRLATCGQDGVLFVFNAETGDQLAQIMRGVGRAELHAVDWSPDGRQLLSGGYDQMLRVWDAVRGDRIEAAQRLEQQVRLTPKNGVLWRELAEVCTRLGWASRARSAYTQAQEIAPDDAGLRAAAQDAEAQFERVFDSPAD